MITSLPNLLTLSRICVIPVDAPSLCPRGMDRSQGFTGDSGATDGLSALGAVLPGPCEACVDPLPDHGAFEFGKYAHHLEQGLAARRGRIDPLPVEVEMHANGL